MRIGLLDMQTAPDEEINLPSTNYLVAVAQQKLWTRSNLSFIFINKQAFRNDSSESFTLSPDNYNRVVGADFNLASADSRWTGKFYYHHSFSPDQGSRQNYSHGARLEYNVREFRVSYEHMLVGRDFDAEVGFVPRRDIFRISPSARLYFYPKGKKINRHGPRLNTSATWSQDYGYTDHEMELTWELEYESNAEIQFTVRNLYTYLFSAFDPTNTGGLQLPEGASFYYTNGSVSYRTDRRKTLSGRIELLGGQYFNGMRFGLSGNFNLRMQPLGFISLDYAINRISLPEPYASTTLYLIGPRIDLTFTDKLFFTTFIQYNSQIENINVNARFQWRFAPVSDFFLVYTDNYLASSTSNLKVKNRGIVAKLTYWLNL